MCSPYRLNKWTENAKKCWKEYGRKQCLFIIMPLLKELSLYFVNCISPASSEIKGNSDRVSSDSAACPSAGVVMTSASNLFRKSASVGFPWLTLNISSGPLVNSDSMNKTQTQHLGKKCTRWSVPSAPFYLEPLVPGETVSDHSVMFCLWGSWRELQASRHHE